MAGDKNSVDTSESNNDTTVRTYLAVSTFLLRGLALPIWHSGTYLVQAQSTEAQESAAAGIGYLSQQMDRFHNRFPIYDDLSSPGNHFHAWAKIGADPSAVDTDRDGDDTPDCIDSCPDDVSKTSPGVCGCGIADAQGDSDSDGTPDCLDGCPSDPNKTKPGTCGCGVAEDCNDRPEVQPEDVGTAEEGEGGTTADVGQSSPESDPHGAGAGICPATATALVFMTLVGFRRARPPGMFR